MKTLILNYTFDATAKTVTFADYATINLERILLITNVTSGVIIYQFNLLAKLGTVATNVLTLAFNTAAMSNTDKLQIYYDGGEGAKTKRPISTISRNSDTISYTVDDVWGTRFLVALPITGNNNNSVILTKVNLITSLTTFPTGFGSFRLFLFQNTTDSGNIADNAAFTQRTTAIDVDGYLLSQMQKAANDAGGRSSTFDLNTPIHLDDGVSSLYAYLITNAAITSPLAAADTIMIRPHFIEA